MIYRSILIIIVLLLLLSGCSSDTLSSDGDSLSAAQLLGLTEDHALEYFQIDTIVTYLIDTTVSPYPVRTVTETTITRTFSITQDEDNWIVSEGGQPLLNLIVSGDYVLHNGYYIEASPSFDLVFFLSPAILMIDAPAPDEPWTSYTEPYRYGADSLMFNSYCAYFGFYAEKSYAEEEEILVPAGAKQVYRFEVDLFTNETNENPVAHATEYYESGVGLVKLRFEDSGFIRTLNLIRTYSIE